MRRVVFLDAGPLGILTNRAGTPETDACREWLASLLTDGARVIIPEIADYEVRRELLRARKETGIARLDALASRLEYVPITTAVMRRAAELWADSRNRGQATADQRSLDGDVILAAQTGEIAVGDVIIATANIRHLRQFAPADLWRNISARE